VLWRALGAWPAVWRPVNALRSLGIRRGPYKGCTHYEYNPAERSTSRSSQRTPPHRGGLQRQNARRPDLVGRLCKPAGARATALTPRGGREPDDAYGSWDSAPSETATAREMAGEAQTQKTLDQAADHAKVNSISPTDLRSRCRVFRSPWDTVSVLRPACRHGGWRRGLPCRPGSL